MSKMNSTSLYVTTNQIILKSQPANPATWKDLYRLLPYLRNSLSCVVCGCLLISPITPTTGKCQHHLCKKCTGGKKQIKPACVWCKDCDTYNENKQLRTLLQCYKKMCIYLSNSEIYKAIVASMGVECGAANLLALIKEGAMFQDEYESNAGLTKEIYSILPCVYTNTATQTLQTCNSETNSLSNVNVNKNMVLSQKNTNGASMYSVMVAGTGNKITIKRKPKEAPVVPITTPITTIKKEPGLGSAEKSVFKRPSSKCAKPRRGCRCGNATAVPGKLTCCGQRCPCYVESKACVDCKCRGCRNPHMLDGNKVLNIPQILQYDQIHNLNHQGSLLLPAITSTSSECLASLPLQQHTQQDLLQHVKIELDANLTIEQLNEHLSLKVFEPFSEVPPTLPHTFLMSTKREDEDEEISVDV